MMEKLINLLLSVAAFVKETGVKISYSPKGLRIFIPWTETLKSPPAQIEAAFKEHGDLSVTETSMADFFGKIVMLNSEGLEQEKKRILALAETVLPEERSEIRLIPWLHYRQCWEIVLHLRYHGFAVRPSGEMDETGSVKFRPKGDGTITLWVRRKDSSVLISEPGSEKDGISFEPPAEWLATDLEEIVEIKLPPPPAQKEHGSRHVPKKVIRLQKNRQNSKRVSALLARIHIERVPFAELEAPDQVPRRFLPAKAAPHRKKA